MSKTAETTVCERTTRTTRRASARKTWPRRRRLPPMGPPSKRSLIALIHRVRASVGTSTSVAYETWLEALSSRCSAHTLSSYGRDVAQLVASAVNRLGADAVPAQIDRHVLRAWLGELSRSCGPSTRARKIAAARSFFRHLCQRGELAMNPALELVLPRLVRPLPHALDRDHASAIIEACPVGPEASAVQARDRAILEMLFGVGARVSELVALDLDDLRDAEGDVQITSRDRTRRAPLGSRAQEALTAYRRRRAELRDPVDGSQDDRALFLTRSGMRIGVRRVQQLVSFYALWGTGRRDVHPHALRHSFAVALLDGGADVSAVHVLLGNRRIASTERYRSVAVAQLTAVHRAAHPLGRGRRAHVP